MAYSNKQIALVASFVKTLKGTHPPNPKAPQGELYKEEIKPPSDSAAVKEKKTGMK
jgi:cytochrome c oxidase cbb3-type subunit 3